MIYIYIYIIKGIVPQMISNMVSRFSLVWFYGISTITGHSMPNPFYTYILNI